jgi:hypothetical protein
MQTPNTQKFKDEMTRRFHDYFYQKLRDKEIDSIRFYEDFGVSDTAKYQFFSAMRSGYKGITSQQIQIAWEKYGVRPDYLFSIVNQAESMAAEPPPRYAKSVSTDIAKIRKLLDDLEKKIENK